MWDFCLVFLFDRESVTPIFTRTTVFITRKLKKMTCNDWKDYWNMKLISFYVILLEFEWYFTCVYVYAYVYGYGYGYAYMYMNAYAYECLCVHVDESICVNVQIRDLPCDIDSNGQMSINSSRTRLIGAVTIFTIKLTLSRTHSRPFPWCLMTSAKRM